VREVLSQQSVALYDRDGEEHYNIASAFIKSMRGSDADAALYYGFRMLAGGEDPRFLIRRMVIFASEDIGNADPRALQVAVATLQAFELVGLPEGRIPIAQCITYLATAPKSNRSYMAMHSALSAVRDHPDAPVPMHLRNAPTKLMKDLGYGSGYRYAHDEDNAYAVGQRYLPEALGACRLYEPSDRGNEKTIKERMMWLQQQAKENGKTGSM
jgi:putative ATPase